LRFGRPADPKLTGLPDARRADAEELHAVLLQAEADQALRFAVERVLIGQSQVLEPPARHAPDVIVSLARDFKARWLAAHLVFLHMALVSKLAEIAVDGSEADGRKAAAGLGKDLVGRRMVATPLDDLIDQAVLAALPGCSSALGHESRLVGLSNRLLKNQFERSS
jgi:hypothetical protein